MAWQSKPHEQVQQDWQVRSAKKREELSLSIEETLADDVLIEDPFSDEVDEAFQDNKSSVIIPPKLSLQSKPIPVVRIESKEVTSITSQTITDSVVVPQTAHKKRRLAGRTTKVHLQAVPKSEKKSENNVLSSDRDEKNNEKSNSKRNSSSERGVIAKRKMGSVASGSLAGSSVLRQGQRDVMVNNIHISSSSVVIVTLVEDPGPVVVKFITLQPQIGFTLHFSDSAVTEARFNYVILMGELF